MDTKLDGGSRSDRPEAGEDAHRRSWWIPWVVGRKISCANKLGGGWEREKVQRAAKRYGDHVHGISIGSRLPLLAAIMAARAPPPQTTDVE